MKQSYLIALSIVLVFLNEARATERIEVEARSTHDGRFGTKCDQFIGGIHGACRLNFFRLLAEPEAYDEKKVIVSGFLIIDEGGLFMFPQMEYYLSGGFEYAVQLTGEFDGKDQFVADAMKALRTNGHYFVTVAGVLDAHHTRFVGAADVVSSGIRMMYAAPGNELAKYSP